MNRVFVIVVTLLLTAGFTARASHEAFLSRHPVVERFVLAIQIVGGAITLIALTGIIAVAVKSLPFRAQLVKGQIKRGIKEAPKKIFTKEWESIKAHLEDAGDKEAPFLIIEADALMDRALKAIGLPGITMAERLNSLEGSGMADIDGLWEAHKIRNRAAHEGGKDIKFNDAVYVFEKYEKALKDFGMI